MGNYCKFDGSGDAAVSSLTTAITGDLDVRVQCRAADWTPAASVTLASQAGGAGARNWMLILESTATLRFYYSTDGTNWVSKGESVHLHDAVTLVDNTTDIWLRVTHDVNDGAGGSDVDFWYSWDGTTWTKYATAHTASTVTRYNANYAHKVGVNSTSDNVWNGRIYSAEIRSGIAGSIVANPDFTAWTIGATSKADSTGNTWTLTGCSIVSAGVYGADWYQPGRRLGQVHIVNNTTGTLYVRLRASNSTSGLWFNTNAAVTTMAAGSTTRVSSTVACVFDRLRILSTSAVATTGSTKVRAVFSACT